MTSLAHCSVFQQEHIFSVPLFNSLLIDILANLTDEGTCQDYLLEKELKHTVGVHKGTTKMLKSLELMLERCRRNSYFIKRRYGGNIKTSFPEVKVHKIKCILLLGFRGGK